MQGPGDILGGRYRLDTRIGSGGMGNVYHARDLLLRRPVAVKLLLPALADDPDIVMRFQREARAAASLQHPGIATLFDQGDDGVPYLVMELVEGGNVADLLRESATLPIARAVEIAAEVLDALDHAHERGVIHCDVKADNVLLTPDGRAKLADFGIARVATEATLTRAGQVHGSAHYLAPERLAGEPATPAGDVYATGMLLYRMLAGRFPFTGDHVAAIAAQQERGAPRPPSEWRPDVPPWLDAAVLRAVAARPANRFSSAGAMRSALLDAAPPDADLPTLAVVEATMPSDAPTRQASATTATSPATTVSAARGGAPPSSRGIWPVAVAALAALAVLVVLVAAGRGDDPPASGTEDPGASVPSGAIAAATETAPASTDTAQTLPSEQPAPPAPTATTEPAVESTAPAPDEATRTPDARLDALRALVAGAGSSRWKPNTQRDLLRRIDDIEERLAKGKPDDASAKLDDLAGKIADLAERDEITPALARQLLDEIDALEESV